MNARADNGLFRWRHACERAALMCAVACAIAIALPTFWLSLASAAFVLCWLAAAPWPQTRALLAHNRWAQAALALGLWLLLSACWSPLPWEQALRAVWPYRKLLLLIALMAILRDPQWGWRMLYGFLGGFALLLGLSYAQALGFAPPNRWHTPSGYTSHIAYSTMLAFVTWATVWLATAEPRRRRLWLGYAAAAATNLFFINTGRTGQAVFLLLLLLHAAHAFYQRWRWRGIGLTALLGASLAALLFVSSPTFRARTVEGLGDIERAQAGEVNTSLAYRLDFWRNTVELAQTHPWLGGGIGSYAPEYAALAARHGWIGARVSHNPHSEYLLIWHQSGAIGLALLLLLGWAHARENRRLSPPVSQIAQGFLILVGVAALFNSILYDHQDGHFYVIIAAALWSAGRSSPASRHPVP